MSFTVDQVGLNGLSPEIATGIRSNIFVGLTRTKDATPSQTLAESFGFPFFTDTYIKRLDHSSFIL
jgi:hypothetical protein